MSEKFLVLLRRHESGEYDTLGIMNGSSLEEAGENWAGGGEVCGVPLVDVLALAGMHEDSGPARMLQPMTVDQVALRITAALFVNPNPMSESDCVEQAWNTAALFMAEAMKRDAMGVSLELNKENGDEQS